MFCNQCEQTAQGTGCSKIGACGKKPEVSDLQDLLMHGVQGLALYAAEGRRRGIVDEEADLFTMQAIFSTLTNVDFDPARFQELIKRAVELRESVKAKVAAAGGRTDFDQAAATFTPADSIDGLAAQGAALDYIRTLDEDENIRSLKQTLLYGLKGIAAYADHAWILGQKDDAIAGFLYEALVALMTTGLSVDACVAVALKAGEINLLAMKILDAGNTGTYGHP
ncbi:MAG TPA: hydroxylamine reductase, partial [Desulfobacteraceae bacterium]|nr:hydroxylamine reductase [Desulfobacteraceae bacterium]